MVKSALTVLVLALALPYACAPVYRFPEAKPFAGDRFYNPYASLPSPAWKRANLHAHGRAWLGVTSAKQSDAEVAAAYRAHGYEIAVISDYQHIAAPADSPLAAYEHGYNVGKHHQLGLGATSVAWFDLPLWQGTNQKQYVINEVAARSSLVAICHPAALQGYAYADDELDELTGYQLMEVVNGRFTTESSWDAALSAGRAVWVIGDDDTHDVTQPDRFGVAWNMIGSATTDPVDVVDALRRGRTYTVLNTNPDHDQPRLSSVDVANGILTVRIDGGEGEFSFIGQNGEVKRTVDDASEASYAITPADTYIRTRVKTASHLLFVNPIVRYDGRALPAPAAAIDPFWTWVERIGILAFCALLVASIVRRHLRRRGAGGTDTQRPWRRVAAWTVVLAALVCASAAAQDAPPKDPNAHDAPGGDTVLPSTIAAPYESTFDASLLRLLPTGDSVFGLIETANVETISDRVSTGGVGFGSAPRLSAFGSSVTQTRYRIGDVDITDPSAGGTPMFLPELNVWQRVSVATGISGVVDNNPGLTVGLQPRMPTATWTTSAEGSTSFGDLLTAAPPMSPAIARVTEWNRASAVVSGPLVPNTAGLVVAGAVTHTSESDRGAAPAVDNNAASLFAHLVVNASPTDEVRTVALLQRTTFPATHPAVFATPQPSLQDSSFHVQSTWMHAPWRLFAGYTQRNRTPQAALVALNTVDRLTDGPMDLEAIDSGARADRRITLGGRASTRRGSHALEAGVDVALARSSSDPGFGGTLVEAIDGTPTRAWRFQGPGVTSHRGSNSLAFFVADRLQLNERSTVDAALRIEHLGASADGAAQGISWTTVMPHAMFRSRLSERYHADWFVGAGVSAYQLPLDTLAWGDPAAPSIAVSTVGGLPLYNVGPGGTGRIDPNLKRPYSADVTFGVQAHPTRAIAIELAGLTRWDKQLLGVVNVSPNGPRYTTVDVADPGLDLPNPADDQVLHVFNYVPAGATPYSFDNVLTNIDGATARRLGLKLNIEYTGERLFVAFGAAAYEAEGRAASRGFQSSENDQGLVGEDPLFPNATIYDSGRLFGDRAFAGKVSGVYRFPADVTLGAIARYHDGQPFSRLVIVPNLGQGIDFVRAFASGGSRFTFTATLDVRLQKVFVVNGYRVAGYVDAYNLTNRGDEVDERAVTGTAFRTPTAFQPPRSARVGVRLEF